MAVLLVVDTPPCSSERPCSAFRLGEAPALRDERVDVLFMGDGVHAARVSQDPRDAQASLRADARRAARARCERRLLRGTHSSACEAEDNLVAGVTLATSRDLAESVARSERTLSF